MRPLTGWDGPRTPAHERRSRWTFKAPWSDTLTLLERELRHLAARDVVLEADFREQDLRLDGLPRANARQPEDPAVRISFDSKHGPLVYAADSCEYWQHNVRSIALGLEALRAVDRYGITRRAEQYTGWRQIGTGPSIVPDPPMGRRAAALTLVRAAYPADERPNPMIVTSLELDDQDALTVVARRAQRNTHPDTRDAHLSVTFDEVQRAIALLREEVTP